MDTRQFELADAWSNDLTNRIDRRAVDLKKELVNFFVDNMMDGDKAGHHLWAFEYEDVEEFFDDFVRHTLFEEHTNSL